VIKDIAVNLEPLPGYRLLQHIGSGGYGEVWRAEAPGGLVKAIKFVFGNHHDKRASNELRALDHIRGVRHPFLLSLERIEVVDGRLLIVSELADGSIKDRFDAVRREGLAGIPREELLGYLRDAADALDFMSQSHALQHLDIKPENLLLLAGHVKVADFGLVKNVRHSQASLVGGMTPLYAAPEVFRGTPSAHSDQYSLAIVYLEMLTGTLPFAGGNVAELTLQHLNDEPNLSALSPTDRYAVSRALSKDPQYRYVSCREFIESLLRVPMAVGDEPGTSNETYAAPILFGESAPTEAKKTDFFEDSQPASWSGVAEHIYVELPACETPLADLPPVSLADCDTRPAPTLVLGIGGTAARVLSHFRRMILQQSGAASDLPAVQFLLLDTDSRDTSATSRETGGLESNEILNLTLRRPQQYRDNSQQLLQWLSRRWLYNIPRSLKTEGLRPLGRLALADHAQQAGQHIRRAVAQALESQSLARSSGAFGQGFRDDAFRVYVVASISGGTGSGMSIDLGYAVRAILNKLGLAQTRIVGIMLHSTGREARYSELARVNAFSWLAEYEHFRQVDGAYPGDASCGLPPHPAGVTAFDDAYLLHLGDNLDATEFDQATQMVADYLRLNIMTPARAYFDACRECLSEPRTAGSSAATGRIRSFGLYRLTAAASEFCDEFAYLVSQQVIGSWRNADRSAAHFTNDAGSFVRRLQLEAKAIVVNSRALLEIPLNGNSDQFLTTWLESQSDVTAPGETGQFEAVDRIFGDNDFDGPASDGVSLLGQSVAAIVQPFADKLRHETRQWIVRCVDDPGARVGGALDAAKWLCAHLQSVGAELSELRGATIEGLRHFRETAQSVSHGIPSGAGGNRSLSTQRAGDYFSSRVELASLAAAEQIVRGMISDAKAACDELVGLGREVDQIATGISRNAPPAPSDSSASGLSAHAAIRRARLLTNLQAQLADLAKTVDSRLQAEYIAPQGGLAGVVMQGGRPRAQLTAKLHELSRQVVQHALVSVNVLEGGIGNDSQSNSELRSGLAVATPALLEFGGSRRVLALVPSESAMTLKPEVLSKAIGAPVTLMAAADNSLTLCVEADGLSVPHIALSFVDRRRDRVEFAERVHCRTDVSWTPLVTTTATPAEFDWSNDAARQTKAQHAMCKTMVI
jgi:serine/threonine protein kinase